MVSTEAEDACVQLRAECGYRMKHPSSPSIAEARIDIEHTCLAMKCTASGASPVRHRGASFPRILNAFPSGVSGDASALPLHRLAGHVLLYPMPPASYFEGCALLYGRHLCSHSRKNGIAFEDSVQWFIWARPQASFDSRIC